MTEQNKAPLTMDTHTLLHELMCTHRLLQKNMQESQAAEQKPTFLVARLVQGMDKEKWQNLLSKLPSLGWCAIEMDASLTHSCVYNPFLSTHITKTPPVDALTHALLTAPFIQQLEQEVERAARGNSPLAVVFFSLDYAQFHDTTHIQATQQVLTKAIRRHINSCDSLGILDTGRFALVLPGASLFKTQNILESILQSYTEQYTSVPLTMGIAGNVGRACICTTLLEQADLALQEALREKTSLRVYRETSQNLQHQRTLVQAHEKRFLFGGE